jgi:hypothetical protein
MVAVELNGVQLAYRMGGLVIVSKVKIEPKARSQHLFAVSNLIIKSFGYTYVLLGTTLARRSHN